MRNRWWAMVVLVGGTTLLAACGGSAAPSGHTSSGSGSGYGAGSSPSATPSSSASGSGSVMISEHSTKLGTVLTNASGHTLYWFALDTPTTSKCTGTCSTYWPPVLGMAMAAGGMSLPHQFGTITRPGGQVQVTYDGHPLYTYAADTAPGQVGGNGLKLSGGTWWAMTPSGTHGAGPKPSASSSSGSGYGGGGY